MDEAAFLILIGPWPRYIVCLNMRCPRRPSSSSSSSSTCSWEEPKKEDGAILREDRGNIVVTVQPHNLFLLAVRKKALGFTIVSRKVCPMPCYALHRAFESTDRKFHSCFFAFLACYDLLQLDQATLFLFFYSINRSDQIPFGTVWHSLSWVLQYHHTYMCVHMSSKLCSSNFARNSSHLDLDRVVTPPLGRIIFTWT